MNTICEDPSQCSVSNSTSHWMCMSCIHRLTLQNQSNFGSLLRDQTIEEFLETNKDLMNDLAKIEAEDN